MCTKTVGFASDSPSSVLLFTSSYRDMYAEDDEKAQFGHPCPAEFRQEIQPEGCEGSKSTEKAGQHKWWEWEDQDEMTHLFLLLMTMLLAC
jgi:hypothetical protein